MPKTLVVFFKDSDGYVPVLEWLAILRQTNDKAFAKCVVRVERLEEAGHELRRPEADMLRAGIYELRAKHGRVQYRILYFFHGKNVAILTHALTKEGKVPDVDIDRASSRKKLYEMNPTEHRYAEEVNDGHKQEEDDDD
ncbi:MAG: type II toxin-antitoxin system RelE/ParE family toxin [Planctomycetia bacterium]|nr:type II toxin-antitoxin system RelE/ParE family toxin [Planctomycetia bacterium]